MSSNVMHPLIIATTTIRISSFNDRLKLIIEKSPAKDHTILMGELNIKVGEENTGYEGVMGRHGLEEMNENVDI